VNAADRRHAEASLRAHRLEAAYLVARLSAHDRTRPLVHGLAARGVAIDRYFDKEGPLAVRAAEVLAEHQALCERQAEGDDVEAALAEVRERIGALRADRARLDARLAAELHAFATTRSVLQIRLTRTAL